MKSADNQFYGWFDDASQVTPTYEPPRRGPCLLCGKPIQAQDVRTISLMMAASAYAKRSYFYRLHRTCSDLWGDVNVDGIVFDMINRNHD